MAAAEPSALMPSFVACFAACFVACLRAAPDRANRP